LPRPRSTIRRHVSPLLAALVATVGVTGATPAQAGESRDGTHADQNAAVNTIDSRVDARLRRMSLEQKVSQLFVATVWGKSADEAHPRNREVYGVDTPAEVVTRYQVGGVIYFNNSSTDNIDNPQQLAAFSNGLQRAATGSGSQLPLIISIDQEGGNVTRLEAPATEFPSSMAIGAGRSAADARSLASIIARELRAVGVNQDFAPVADVNSNPLNPIIGARSFSARPELASELVAAEVAGYQNSGPRSKTVASAAKHFPGHGDAATDSHTGLPVISRTEQEWRDIDLPPFQAAIGAGIDSIMTAHIQVPNLDPSGEPATLSGPILTGKLRNELGYNGVVVTDALGMEGVRKLHTDAEIPVLALQAGVDQLLMPPDLNLARNAVLQAVTDGALSPQRIDQSVRRILTLKEKRGILERPFVDESAVPSKVGVPAHLAEAQRITDGTITVLRNDAGLLPLTAKPNTVLVTGWHNPASPGSPANPVATLASSITKRGPAATAMPTGSAPTEEQIAAAVTAAQGNDLVVVLTNNLRGGTAQRALLTRLQQTGKPVIAVAAQVPYDAGFVDSPTWVATYAWRAVSMESLAKVLFGELSPRGALPVDVPSGTDPATIQYPFGTGITW
jgi:beta-N-acetylhexosaminidase